MKLTDARDLAIKLFGLYCVVDAVVLAPQILSVFFMSEAMTQHLTNKFAYGIAVSLPLLLYVAIAYVSLVRTGWMITMIWGKQPAGEAMSQNSTVATSLSFWITLIGVYYFIESSAGLLTQLWILAANREMWGSYWSMKFLPSAITLPVSVVCILRAKRIEDFIQRKAKAQPSASANAASPRR